MRRWWIVCAGLGVVLALTGCIPEKRVVWSPDGQRAIVLSGERKLHFCDADGKLSEPLAEPVHEVAWLPDAKRFVMVREDHVATWDAVAARLAPEYVRMLERVGERLHAEVMAWEGSWDDFSARAWEHLADEERGALLLYLRDRHADTLRGRLEEKWDDIQDIHATWFVLELVEAPEWKLDRQTVLASTLGRIGEVRVSPNGRYVAYVGTAGLPELEGHGPITGEADRWWPYVVPIEGSTAPRTIMHKATMSLDWSADGRYVAYAAASAPLHGDGEHLQLGSIGRCEICDEAGSLLSEFPGSEDLAGMLFEMKESTRVRCLPDGRIVFATIEVTLPSTSADMPERCGLFALDLQRSPTLTRLIPRQAEDEVPEAAFFFEPSPDGRYACVPGMEGQIAVLTLATGEVWHAVCNDEIDHLRTLPVWRSPEEVCCVVVPRDEQGHPARPELALFKVPWHGGDGEPRLLSKQWSDESVVGLLISREELDKRKRAITTEAD